MRWFKNSINRKETNNEVDFNQWLDKILEQEMPTTMVAVNFNIYDDGNYKWALEFVGTDIFDENDTDWACNEVFVERDNPFVIEKECD